MTPAELLRATKPEEFLKTHNGALVLSKLMQDMDGQITIQQAIAWIKQEAIITPVEIEGKTIMSCGFMCADVDGYTAYINTWHPLQVARYLYPRL